MSDTKSPSAGVCPHCNKPMKRWQIPDDLPFDEEWHWVCFNDDCPYYLKGWEWMAEKFGRPCSYRHRQNSASNESGPLATWSSEALREGIMDDG